MFIETYYVSGTILSTEYTSAKTPHNSCPLVTYILMEGKLVSK